MATRSKMSIWVSIGFGNTEIRKYAKLSRLTIDEGVEDGHGTV